MNGIECVQKQNYSKLFCVLKINREISYLNILDFIREVKRNCSAYFKGRNMADYILEIPRLRVFDLNYLTKLF